MENYLKATETEQQPTADSEPTKLCSKCRQYLPLSEFSKLSRANDGLQYTCKKCQREDYFARKANKITPPKLETPLAHLQPRVIINELRARGYTGDLYYKVHIKL
jgi:hypothetical protein